MLPEPRIELLYSSGERSQSVERAHMTVIGAVTNNDGREILAVLAPSLLKDFGTDRFLIADISRKQPISVHVRSGKVPVFLMEHNLPQGGIIDVNKAKPKVLDRGLVMLK